MCSIQSRVSLPRNVLCAGQNVQNYKLQHLNYSMSISFNGLDLACYFSVLTRTQISNSNFSYACVL